jgi:hypothetical protein
VREFRASLSDASGPLPGGRLSCWRFSVGRGEKAEQGGYSLAICLKTASKNRSVLVVRPVEKLVEVPPLAPGLDQFED